MAISDISLTAGMKSSLLSLKGTSIKIDRTQERLSTGKKVNSALDNPTNFFASRAHLDRASDLGSRKDGMAESIKTGEAAGVGLEAITSLINNARAIANSAYTAPLPRNEQANLFNGILKQIDSLAEDSGYRGLNLLKNEELTVIFNENSSSTITIEGVNAASAALGIAEVGTGGDTIAGGGHQGNTIAAGGNSTFALKDDGSVVAWGYNGSGQTTVPPAAQSGVVSIAAGHSHAVALKDDGSVVAWGNNGSGETTVPPAAQSGVVAIAAGGSYTVALKDDGSVVAWGYNYFGQTTVPPAAQSGVVAIAAGLNSTFALKDDGSVVAWGDNAFGETTVPPAAQSGVVSIAAEQYYTVALKDDGSVVAWGDNGDGQTTVPPAAQSGVVAIAVGGNSTFALKDDGSVVAWGYNVFGQTTVPPAAQSGVVAIAAGHSHAVALKDDGSVVAWGYNGYGQTTIPPEAQSGIMVPSSVQDSAWSSDAGIAKSEQELEAALSFIRSNAVSLASSMSIIAIRQTFTINMINTLQTGSDNLTLADMNEESANMLMLQTRQNLGVTSLSMGSQAAQSVMRLF